MMKHFLKIKSVFFNEIKSGHKKFEIRFDDRNFKIGDFLVLQEFNTSVEKYTGDEIEVFITNILYPEECKGLENGYCIMSISEL